ncbi:MAG TPA: hypothetical protein VJ417_04810, partial [Candidatus Glassbacteria bacterium]|nr:hypothetical protein [Candidatus Glassbacteria bacterium]
MKRKWFTLAIFLITLGIYLFTLAPSLASYNSASWIVNGLFAGLPPAPGNLFYLLICAFAAKFFTVVVKPVLILVSFAADAVRIVFIPSLEPAVGVNLVSALSGAGAAALVYTLFDRFAVGCRGAKARPDTGPRLIVAAGTIGMALLPAFWSAAVA